MPWLILIAVWLAASNLRGAEPIPLSIAGARIDANGDFVPDRLGEPVQITGTLTSLIELHRSNQQYASIQDDAAGISLHFVKNHSATNHTLVAGDKVRVSGSIEQSRGTEALRVASIEKIGVTPLPTPLQLTIREAQSKKHMGRLVRLSGQLRLAPDFSATKPMLLLKDDSSEVAILLLSLEFIGKVEFASQLFKADRADVTGVMAQWDLEAPFDNNFFLAPRSPGDFVIYPAPPYGMYAAAAIILTLTVAASFLWLSQRRTRATSLELQAVTERLQQSQAELTASEKRLRGIFENSIGGVFQSSFDGKYIHLNRALANMLGYESSEAVLATIKSIGTELYVNPSDRNRFMTELREKGYVENFEVQFRRRDGSPFWLLTNARLVKNEKGAPLYIEGMNLDVTARKEAEEKLRASEGLYTSLVDTIPHPVYRKDKYGRYTFASAAFMRMIGLAEHQLIGKTPLEIFPENFARKLIAEDAQVLANGGNVSWIESGIRDEQTRSFHIFKSAIHAADGSVVGLQGISIDITEQRQLELQLRQAGKMESIGRLAGGIAHDFNNLLTVIQGQASLAIIEKDVSPSVRSSLEEIILSSEKASNLTRQLLMFSRKRPFQLKPICLAHSIAEMSKLLQRLLGERIHVQNSVEPSVAATLVLGDESMLEQVLLNLAVNSRDAMPNGGLFTLSLREALSSDLQLRPGSLNASGYLCLEAIDTGSGISEDNLSHIFEPFFTTKDVGQGTGIGLATVYAIVQQHKGWIEVKSELGKGALFQIFLPIADRSHRLGLAPAPLPQDILTQARILLVEDEEAVRTFLETALERSGFTVATAADADAGVHAYLQADPPFDLVITDVVMPGGKSGKDLAETLRAINPDLLVIFISGYSPEEIFGGIIPPETSFLQKPFSPRVLTQEVSRLLARRSDAIEPHLP